MTVSINAIKILLPFVLSFIVGFVISKPLLHFFIKQKLWRKKSRSQADLISDQFKELHTDDELSTPRVGGVIVWLTTTIVIVFLYGLASFIDSHTLRSLNFLSRAQTLIPLGALLFAAMLGLGDDLLTIKSAIKSDSLKNRRIKIGLVILVSFLIGLWFVFKIDHAYLYVPFLGRVYMGLMFIPLFIMVTLAVFSTSVIDGVDGLAGSVMVPIFAAYSIIAYTQLQIDISAFCAVIAGSLLVFLWRNVPPAKWYMGETGMLALTVVLSVIAFLTDAVLPLIIIAFPMVMTSFSVILQILSYKYRNKKRIFLITPIHHHFEAKGWSRSAITMRYQILSIICASLGTILTLIS
jgi:phospho-N-acetylmuramoyl-pentapeptide-transferase